MKKKYRNYLILGLILIVLLITSISLLHQKVLLEDENQLLVNRVKESENNLILSNQRLEEIMDRVVELESNIETENISLKESEIKNIFAYDESWFIKHATCENASMYRLPDTKSEYVGNINDTVLIYSVYRVQVSTNLFELWAYVEYVGEPDDGVASDQSGYVKINDLNLVEIKNDTRNQFGLGDVYIGSRYENVIDSLGTDYVFIKGEYKDWYMFFEKEKIFAYIDPKTLCVRKVVVERPNFISFQLNDYLTTKIRWNEFIDYLDENRSDYKIIDSGVTEFVEWYTSDNIKVSVGHVKGNVNLEYLKFENNE